MHMSINMASDIIFIIFCPMVLFAGVRLVQALQILAAAVAECQRNFARQIEKEEKT